MKGINFVGGIALSMTMLAPVVLGTSNVFALENDITVTEAQLDQAIETAEQAILKTRGIESVAGQSAYLENLVAQAKEVSLYFYSSQDQNLGELVAALSEGARGIILVSGVNRTISSNETKPEVQALNTESQSTPAILAVEERAAQSAPVAQNATTTAQNVTTIAQNATEKTEPMTKKAETQVAANVGVSVTVAKDETIDELENPLGENEDIEVPKTGEEENMPSPVAVAITAGVTVFVAAAGTAAIVKRLKRDA